MENPEATLQEWRKVGPTSIALASLTEEESLQPRSLKLVTYRDQSRQTRQSAEQVAQFRLILQASASAELEPILVAKIGATFQVVDGHHRLTAYRLANRTAIPCRVLEVDRSTAVIVSKLVNLDGVKLPLHKLQAREALWQYVAFLTFHGRQSLPKGHSCRTLGAQFAASPDTVHRMVKRAKEVDPAEYAGEAKDQGTGWPRWKYVNGPGWNGIQESMTPEMIRDRKAEKAAKALGKLLEQHGEEAVLAGLQLLRREECPEDRSAALADLQAYLGESAGEPSDDF